MWLRDSTNQLLPYIDLIPKDSKLAELFEKVVQRQAKYVVADPV